MPALPVIPACPGAYRGFRRNDNKSRAKEGKCTLLTPRGCKKRGAEALALELNIWNFVKTSPAKYREGVESGNFSPVAGR